MDFNINISQYDYNLPTEKIAKFPLVNREGSKLLLFKEGQIEDVRFYDIKKNLPDTSLVVFNNTKVICARLIFTKSTGAKIEVFCLEPTEPTDYERAFSAKQTCVWNCIVGNSKKWKEGEIFIYHDDIVFSAERSLDKDGDIIFRWNTAHPFGELLELLGQIPIPPYLERESEEIDSTRYQTMYSKIEGSVAAPTAGLHFSEDILKSISRHAEVTLHVGAGTFLPVKCDNVADHSMHTEFFRIEITELEKLADAQGDIIAVGTTTVRTLESLALLGERVADYGDPTPDQVVGQWEGYKKNAQRNSLKSLHTYMVSNNLTSLNCSTQIMIAPGYKFRTIKGLLTNFHQPKSTLLLLVSAAVGDSWHKIYDHALNNDYRFLSYGDSSLLMLTEDSKSKP